MTAGPPAPLPVGETGTAVLRTLRGRTAAGLRSAWAPFTMVFLAEGLTGVAGGGVATAVLSAVVSLVAYTMFLVDWHRLVLLGPGATPPRLRPTRRDLEFFGRSLLVGLVTGLGLLLPLALFAPGLMALPGGIFVVQAVASLLGLTGMLALGGMLPATAVGESCSLGASWRATRAVLPALLGLVLLLMAPVHILGLASQVLYHAAVQGGGVTTPVLVLAQALTFLELALFATLLSTVYRRRVAGPPATGPADARDPDPTGGTDDGD